MLMAIMGFFSYSLITQRERKAMKSEALSPAPLSPGMHGSIAGDKQRYALNNSSSDECLPLTGVASAVGLSTLSAAVSTGAPPLHHHSIRIAQSPANARSVEHLSLPSGMTSSAST